MAFPVKLAKAEKNDPPADLVCGAEALIQCP